VYFAVKNVPRRLILMVSSHSSGVEFVNRRPNAVDSGVGENRVEPSEFFNGLRDGFFHFSGVGNVRQNRDCLAARRFYFVNRFAQFVFRPPERRDARAFFGKQESPPLSRFPNPRP
jgi:hypothetical protein